MIAMLKSSKRELILIYRNLYKFFTRKKHLLKIYSFFNESLSAEYILIKKNINFPNIPQGSDFDIYVLNEESFSNSLISYFEKFENYKITLMKTKIRSNQVDLYYKGRFIYKFDLLDSAHIPDIFNKSFIEDSLNKKTVHHFLFKGKKMKINIPENAYENLIRFVEHKIYPEKIHHLKHIENLHGSETEELKRMIKKYTNI